MTDEAAISFAKAKAESLGFQEYACVPLQVQIQGGQSVSYQAINEMYLVVEAENPIRVESQRGVFDLTDPLLPENEYFHRFGVTVTNNDYQPRTIRFVKTTLISK